MFAGVRGADVEERRTRGGAADGTSFAEHPRSADEVVRTCGDGVDDAVHILVNALAELRFFVFEELVANPLYVAARGFRDARDEVHFGVGGLNCRRAVHKLVRGSGRRRNPRGSAEIDVHFAVAAHTAAYDRGLHVVTAAEDGSAFDKPGFLPRFRGEPLAYLVRILQRGAASSYPRR